MKTRGAAGRSLLTVGVLTGLTLVAGFVVACGGGGDEGSAGAAEEVAAGQQLFRTTCATCHGPSGEGMANLGKNLNANEFIQSRSDAELVEFIKLGRPASHPDNTQGVDMPPMGGNPMLTDEDLLAIVGYMRSIQ